jgi:hypothetical protein
MLTAVSRVFAVSLAALAACASDLPAGERPAALPHRTPRELLREIRADRPDKTESPYTVNPGWLQIEMDLVNYTFDSHNPDYGKERVERWAFATTNLKFGLLHNVDLQLVFEPYTMTRTGPVRANGFGDLTVRTKFNLWGNDGGATALAVMPFVKIPTNQDGLGNHAVEGGIIVPFAIQLPGAWSAGVMTEVDAVEDSDAGGHHAEWVNSITFSRDIAGPIGGYVEFFCLFSTERHAPWVGTFDAGFTVAVSEDLQLDFGVNVGLTRSADDIQPFLGFTWRF